MGFPWLRTSQHTLSPSTETSSTTGESGSPCWTALLNRLVRTCRPVACERDRTSSSSVLARWTQRLDSDAQLRSLQALLGREPRNLPTPARPRSRVLAEYGCTPTGR